MQKILMDIDSSENSKPDVEIIMNIIIRKLFLYLFKAMTTNFGGFMNSKKIRK